MAGTGGGKRYGLILRKPPAGVPASTRGPVKGPSLPSTGVSAAFGGDDSDEDDMAQRIAAQQRQLYGGQATQPSTSAHEAGGDVADYDAWLGEQQAQRKAEREAKRRQGRTSRYIGTLKRNAERRAFQQEKIRERVIQKEQEAEAEQFGDKERFVTSAYKAKLAADKQREEEEAAREAEEAARSARGRSGMAGFYANLAHNVALGGAGHDGQRLAKPPAAASAPPAQPPAASVGRSIEAPSRPAAPVPRPAPAAAGFDDDFDEPEVFVPGQAPAPAPAPAPSPEEANRGRSRSPPPVRREALATNTVAPPRQPSGVGQDAVAAAKARALERAKARAAARAAQS